MPQYEGINLFHMQQMKKAVTRYVPHSPFTREILNAMASSIGTFIPYDWRSLIKAVLKPGEYLQWTMWFQDIARDHANRNARAGAPQNQIPFGMLTGTGQFDTIEAQIRCPPFGQSKSPRLTTDEQGFEYNPSLSTLNNYLFACLSIPVWTSAKVKTKLRQKLSRHAVESQCFPQTKLKEKIRAIIQGYPRKPKIVCDTNY
ncbi:hypothetical protein Celaphus_00015984 [Cervus elaphus hippelaphus]|uniref:Uncharacterized protein n=1 Tax=Cervus elaphus hippelaphus TaxID=46360 RepID=A0A212C1V0_CEREH|nr:hypothetical protein Celaphus_00015984 [Cervus elaphus hippelaphus]